MAKINIQGKTIKRVVDSGVLLLAALLLVTLPSPSNANSSLNSRFIQTKGSIAPPTGARELCAKYIWACASPGASRNLSDHDMKVIEDVNRHVNKRVRRVSDQAQYKKVEVWALPTNRGGDCEDFALLKKRDLLAYGIDPSRLLLATVLDRKRNSHAVLIVRSDQGDLVLDNLTNKILTWQATHYTFLRMQNPSTPANWVMAFAGS